MNMLNELSFALSDRIQNVEVGPEHIPLNLLGEFQSEVADFLRGSVRDVNAADIMIAIKPGSLMFVATGLLAVTSLWQDLTQLQSPDALDRIDPKRAAVVERWQAAARKSPKRSYSITDADVQHRLTVDATSRFSRSTDSWVLVEKYVHGRVVDLGGKNKANVHMELDNGMPLIVTATHDQLAKEPENRLYKTALLHITAEENLRDGSLRNSKLIAFEAQAPGFDEGAFRDMVRRGTQAWADVPDTTTWLNELRGGHA